MKEYLFLIFAILFSSINVLSFLSCALDKDHAKRGRNRVRESILLKLSLAFGSYGMLTSMLIFRNKTKKKKFILTVPLLVIIHTMLIFGVYYFFYLPK